MVVGGVEEALGVELAGLDLGPLAMASLAATARALARQIDDEGTEPPARAASARALLDVLNRVRELAPPDQERDRLDDLTARRTKRIQRIGLR